MTGEEKRKTNTTAIKINKKILNEYILHYIAGVSKKKKSFPHISSGSRKYSEYKPFPFLL